MRKDRIINSLSKVFRKEEKIPTVTLRQVMDFAKTYPGARFSVSYDCEEGGGGLIPFGGVNADQSEQNETQLSRHLDHGDEMTMNFRATRLAPSFGRTLPLFPTSEPIQTLRIEKNNDD